MPVCFRALSGTRRGYYDAQSEEIVLSASLTDLEKPRTLIHEIAHKLAFPATNTPLIMTSGPWPK